MNRTAFTLLLGIAITLFVSTNANGGEMQIETDGASIHRSRNNDLYINTENMEFNLPNDRSRIQHNSTVNNASDYSPSWCRNDNVVRQYSRQVNQSGRTSSQDSVSRYYCR